MIKQKILNLSIEDYEKMSINDLQIQEDVLYEKYRLVREVRRYKELREESKGDKSDSN